VRDGISLTKAGLPTIVVVQDSFERAARAQAKALGSPDLKIYVYPQHRAAIVESEEVEKGIKAAGEIRLIVEGRS
jgi:hypothetical protein